MRHALAFHRFIEAIPASTHTHTNTHTHTHTLQAGMGAAENFWGKWTGNGGENNDIDHPVGEIEANHSHPEGNKTYWWHFPDSDCPNDDVAGT